MPMRLPLPERDVPAVRSLDGLAPKFRGALSLLLTNQPDAVIAETLRTPERQSFLYGFGRDYDDGRGIVTQAPTHLTSYHGFGLAADIVHREHGWAAPRAWFAHLADVAETYGLKWGGRWRHPDLPHFYWGGCPDSPTYVDRGLLAAKGIEAVWQSRGAL
jgi:peptidoglycan L-alanyl-D-glutamate endopeptidase CwlK